MLSMLWWLPLVLCTAAIVPLWRGIRRLRREDQALRASIDGLAGLRPLVAEVREEVAAVTLAARAAPRRVDDLGPR